MKKILLPLLIASASCYAGDYQAPKKINPNVERIILDATADFAVLDAGNAPYYIDTNNDALGIDARVDAYRHLFARATTTFKGNTGNYDISMTSVTEEDGEPLYRLLVNGKVVGTYRGSYIGAKSAKDLKPETHTWQNIRLNTGDSLSIESNAHTNGEIPEHGGTAWARGRWQQVELTPAGAIEQPRPYFSKHSDLLVAQYDIQPNVDDIQSIAALGSMLNHDDLKGVNVIAVAGTTGNQGGIYTNANSLFSLAFGKENFHWFDAHNNWQQSALNVRDRARAILAQGGKVWVQEAGQSDFTRDWVEGLINAGVEPSIVKNNVIVVQHSVWNESKTTPEDLAYVKKMVNYQMIDDGNQPKRLFDRTNRRGPLTPVYVSANPKWLKGAISSENSYKAAQKLWQEAVNIIDKRGFTAKSSTIPNGGIDFSDAVANWWIFDLGQNAVSVHAFWERYVTDVELDQVTPPKGRLAVVIDGNSPDPDDIGATPVMFALLQQTDLSDRLVHISHSCDLDPRRNKGYQISVEDELRRQKQLHFLTGKSIELFGPFENLRNYYNCRVDQQGAIDDLVDAINASTAADPLWIIEAGEPDLIGYALQAADQSVMKYVHVVSHHPANDDSGDYFTWQQILDFGVKEHQIGDQNIGLQTEIPPWDWAKDHKNPGYAFIWDMMAYAEKDGVVPFQTNKFDCSDAGMVYWWITGADKGGNNQATANDIKDMLQLKVAK